jgi:hypothetical protein
MLSVDLFQTHTALRDLWYQYIPCNIHDSFFHLVEEKILSLLKERCIIRSMDGTYHPPSKIIILTSAYCDSATALIPERFLPDDMHYLSDVYELRRFQPYLDLLGVKTTMNPSFFRGGLLNMNEQIQAQPDHWHEKVCSLLAEQNEQGKAGDVSISDLKIIPLQDDTWASVGSAGTIIFHLDNRSLPSGLSLRSIRTDIRTSSARYRFFAAIGVKETTPSIIAREILSSKSADLHSLIEQAKFLFTYRRSNAMPPPSNLPVVDQSGTITQGNLLYLDHPLSGLENKTLRDILPAGTIPCVHPDYLSSYASHDGGVEWCSWLRDSLGLNTAPRVLDDGRLSPEFQTIITTLDPKRILIVLREFWPQIAEKLSDASRRELSEIKIVCENGQQCALKDTCLKTKDLMRYSVSGLCFLPIDDLEDHWLFLKNLGVAVQANASIYLALLRRLSAEGSKDKDVIQDIYTQLNVRFQDDPSAVR